VKNKTPTKNDMIKKIEVAKIKKYLNMMKEAAQEKNVDKNKNESKIEE